MQHSQFVKKGQASMSISSIIIIKYWHKEQLGGAKSSETPHETIMCPSGKQHTNQFR